jgi:hypothetical protein
VPDGSVAERRLARRAVAAIACRVRRRHRLGIHGPTRGHVRSKLDGIAEAARALAKALRDRDVAAALEDAWASRDGDEDSRAIYAALDRAPALRATLPSSLEAVALAAAAAVGKLGLAGRAGSKDPWETFQVPSKVLAVYFVQRLLQAFTGIFPPPGDRRFLALLGLVWEIATGEPGERDWRRQVLNASLERPLTEKRAIGLMSASFGAAHVLNFVERRLHAIRR